MRRLGIVISAITLFAAGVSSQEKPQVAVPLAVNSDEVRALWVVRTTLTSREKIARVESRARLS